MPSLLLLGDLAPLRSHHPRPRRRPCPGPRPRPCLSRDAPLPRFAPPPPHSRPRPPRRPRHSLALLAAFPRLTLNLAENHLLDFGAPGLSANLAACAHQGIATFGAGATLAATCAPKILLHDGLRLGLLCAGERQFGHAKPDTAGTAPFSQDLFARIAHLRTTSDRVIVSVHGGGEMSPWPSPQWQQTLRAFIAAGADVVHAHHPHVPLGWERWHDGWIFYGLGNTLINPALWRQAPSARRSWRVQLDLAHLAQAPLISAWESVADAPGASSASAPVALRCTCPAVAPNDPDVTDRNAPLADSALLEGLHQEYAVRLWESFYADRLNPGDTTARRLRLTARTLRDTAFAVFNPGRWRRQRRDRGLFHYHLFSAAAHAGEIATALGLIHGELPDRRTPRTRALAARWLPPALFAS